MSKIMTILEEKLLPMADKLSRNRYLNTLRDGFLTAFPLIIFGSIVVVIQNLPFLKYLMSEETLNSFKDLLAPVGQSTLSLMTVFVILGIGYHYLSHFHKNEGIIGAVLALGSFLILTPFENNAIPLQRLGAEGMFVGIFVGFFSVEIYRYFVDKGWTIKLPASVPPAVSKSFAAIIPGSITLTVFLLIRIIFGFTSYTNIHAFVYNLVQQPLMHLGSGLPATLFAVFMIQFLWFFGLHGATIVNSVLDPIWNALALENLEAFHAGTPLPHIVTKTFMEVYNVGLGGSGLTLPVVVLLLLVVKNKQLKQIGTLAAPAGLFNVNEPVIFGLPVVMNPLVFVPWIFAPMIVVTFNYLVMAIGLVPLTTGILVPWTMPFFINGILATNSLAGGILQLFDFLIIAIIWLPFIKLMDKQYTKNDLNKKDDEDLDLELTL